jgi:TonB family protein
MRFLLLALLGSWLVCSIETAGGARQEPRLVGGDIKKPERIQFVAPVYPAEAESSNVQSVVILELIVDTEGAVSSVRPLRGSPLVVDAAVRAARQWRYRPTFVDGAPVSLRFSETVLFVLRAPVVPPEGSFGGNGMFLRPPAPGATSASYADWEVDGEAVTACPCNTPCPCRSNASPSHPPCHATTAQHFFKGHYGGVDLAGATYVTLGPENWTAIYFDEKLSEEVRRAILDIYASMAPGAPQVYRATRSVPLTYEVSADRTRKRVEIPGVLELESRQRTGDSLLRALGMDVWSNEIFYGETGVYRYHDEALGESWDHSGRQSNHKRFVTSKRMYDERKMLIQLGDGSGSFTPAQEKLLSCLR